FARLRPTPPFMPIFRFAANGAVCVTSATGPAKNTSCLSRSSTKKSSRAINERKSSSVWQTRMARNPDTAMAPPAPQAKPRLALRIAAALGVGQLKPGPGTWGSLFGALIPAVAALLWLINLGHFSGRAVYLATAPFSEGVNDTPSSLFPVLSFAGLFLVSALGVWSAARVAAYAGVEDPQYV